MATNNKDKLSINKLKSLVIQDHIQTLSKLFLRNAGVKITSIYLWNTVIKVHYNKKLNQNLSINKISLNHKYLQLFINYYQVIKYYGKRKFSIKILNLKIF